MMTPLAAAKAYASVAAQASPASLKAATLAAEGPDFGELVTKAVSEAVSSSRNAETQMTNQVQGKADLIDVVTAISSAQASLQTVLAVRDQVISAYKEIMAMPI